MNINNSETLFFPNFLTINQLTIFQGSNLLITTSLTLL